MFLNHKTKVGFGLLAVLTFNTACSASSEKSGIGDDCSSLNFSLSGLPSLVLVGTDVVELSTFNLGLRELSETYQAEMGGASLGLTVSDQSKKKIITRTFKEPGENQLTSVFYPVCQSEELILAGDLKGKIVEEGLLVLEQKAEVEGIPSDLWIFYKVDN